MKNLIKTILLLTLILCFNTNGKCQLPEKTKTPVILAKQLTRDGKIIVSLYDDTYTLSVVTAIHRTRYTGLINTNSNSKSEIRFSGYNYDLIPLVSSKSKEGIGLFIATLIDGFRTVGKDNKYIFDESTSPMWTLLEKFILYRKYIKITDFNEECYISVSKLNYLLSKLHFEYNSEGNLIILK